MLECYSLFVHWTVTTNLTLIMHRADQQTSIVHPECLQHILK